MRSILAVVALVLSGLAAPAAAQQGSEPDGLAVEIRAVSTVAPIKPGDRPLRIYRALLPKGIEPAPDPVVGIWLAELTAPKETPGRPQDEAAHWLEGAIELRVKKGDELGWFNIHYPVTSEFWFQAGRAVGLPKRHADAAIVKSGDGWTATATPRGLDSRPAFVMDWRPGPASDQRALDLAFVTGTDPFFALNAPFEGPDLMRVEYKINPPYPFQTAVPGAAPAYDPATAKPDPGTVALKMRGDLDAINEDLPAILPLDAQLGDLVELEQTLPGAHYFYSLTLGSESATIDQSSYPPRAKVGPERSDARACEKRSRKFRLRLRPGERLRRVRAYVDGRRVPAKRVNRRTASVDLRRVKPGRHRLRVRTRTTRGRAVVLMRRVRLCARA